MTSKKGTSTLAAIGYPARDNDGNPESMTDWTGTWSYDYDGHNRLISATPPNPVPEQPCGGDYGYDWVGNRLNPPTSTNHMIYDAADRLASWPGMYSYSYYSDGSLKEVKNAKGILTSSYTYNPNGLLDEATYVTPQGIHTAVNTWDGNWRRVGLAINEKAYSFVYDPMAGIPAVIEEVADGTSVYYYREPDGTLVARTDAANGIRYYHFDALGSTRLLTDEGGNVTDRYAYDAWGTVVAHDKYEGSIDQPYQYVGRFGYYTHYQDPDFKLLQLGVRFYDYEVGRFVQRDAMREGNMAYSYAYENPMAFVDTSGLSSCNVSSYTLQERQHAIDKCIWNCKHNDNVWDKCSTDAGKLVGGIIGGGVGAYAGYVIVAGTAAETGGISIVAGGLITGATGVIGTALGTFVGAGFDWFSTRRNTYNACSNYCREMDRKGNGKALADFQWPHFEQYWNSLHPVPRMPKNP